MAAVAAVAAAAHDFPDDFPDDFAAEEDVGGESANKDRTAAAAAAAALFVEEEEDDFFVPAEDDAVAAALIAATAARSAEEDEARTGGAIGGGVTAVTATVPTGVAAGEGPAEYNPFSSSTTGPSTMQMSHTLCRPFWPAFVSSASREEQVWKGCCRAQSSTSQNHQLRGRRKAHTQTAVCKVSAKAQQPPISTPVLTPASYTDDAFLAHRTLTTCRNHRPWVTSALFKSHSPGRDRSTGGLKSLSFRAVYPGGTLKYQGGKLPRGDEANKVWWST